MKQVFKLRQWQNLVLGLVCLSIILVSCQIGSSNQLDVPVQTNFASNVQEPKLVGKYEDGYNPMGAIVVQGDYAYIANGQYGLLIIDVSDPTKPVKVSDYETPGESNYVAIENSHVYLTATRPRGLSIIDVTNPTEPQKVNYMLTDSSISVTLDKNYAYLGAGEKGLTIVDISNPQKPVEIVANQIPRVARRIEIANKYAYIVEWGALYVVDISNPFEPFEIANYKAISNGYSLDVQGDYAYIADGGMGLAVVDISDPYSPTLISRHQVPETRPHQDVAVYGIAQSVKVVGDYAYLVDLASLQVIDISDPTTPILVAFYNDFGQAVDVDVVGDYIYVISLSTLTIWEVPKFDKAVEE